MKRLVSAAVLVAVSTLALLWSAALSPATSSEKRSPLEDFLGFGYHSDLEEEVYVKEEARRQDLIQECMLEAGFEYYPVGGDQFETGTDVNRVYRESLSRTDEKAYSLALSGRSASDGMSAAELSRLDSDHSGTVTQGERAGLGCLGRAESSLPGVFAVRGLLAEELADLEQAISEDPVVRSAAARWVGCMNSLGFRGASADAVDAALVTQAAADLDAVRAKAASIEECNRASWEARQAATRAYEVDFYKEHRKVIEAVAYRVPVT
jgi:hypothetical protein